MYPLLFWDEEIEPPLDDPGTRGSPIRRRSTAVQPEQRQASQNSRYHLATPYLRFYFRFIQPNLGLVEQELTDLLWQRIAEQFRAFVGLTAFEELCREWTLVQARVGQLPFALSHWSSDRSGRTEVQVDVVALNWRVGRVKWGVDAVGRSVVRELVEKTPHAAPGETGDVHSAGTRRAGIRGMGR